MHVEKREDGGGKKSHLHFLSPNLTRFCADAKAPPGLVEILGKAGVERRRSSIAGSRGGTEREGDPGAQDGVTEKVTLPRPCRAAWIYSVPASCNCLQAAPTDS